MLILAIESSCDETAASVSLDGRKILSNVVYSQIDMHALYGGGRRPGAPRRPPRRGGPEHRAPEQHRQGRARG